MVNSLYQGAAAAEGAAVKVVADERSNSVLIGGEQSQRLRLRALIAHLDTPLEAGGDTRVRYLHYADAEKIAPKLKEQITGIAQTTGGGGAAGAGGAQGGSPITQAEKNAMVWADPTNNALVITAPPKIMRAVMDIIDKLDIRRPQVLVEAIIAEVDVDKNAELGVNWAAFSNGTNIPAGSFVSPVGGTSIVDLAGAIQNPANATHHAPAGHHARHRAHRRHGRQFRRHAARHPRRHRHQRHRHALGGDHGQPGGGAQGGAGGAVRHRPVHQHHGGHAAARSTRSRPSSARKSAPSSR